MKFTFGIRDHIKKSWALYKAHFGLMILFALIYGFVQVIANTKDNFILSILCIVATSILSYVWIRSILAMLGGDAFKPFTQEMLPSLRRYWDYIKTIALTGLFVMLGMILLIIPGIYVAGRLVFATYLSVEKSQGARKSVRESWEMTKGYGWKLVWKSILIGIFGIVGFIALGFGILVTMPMSQIMKTMLYKSFKEFKKGNIEMPDMPPAPVEDIPTPYVEEVTAEKEKAAE